MFLLFIGSENCTLNTTILLCAVLNLKPKRPLSRVEVVHTRKEMPMQVNSPHADGSEVEDLYSSEERPAWSQKPLQLRAVPQTTRGDSVDGKSSSVLAPFRQFSSSIGAVNEDSDDDVVDGPAAAFASEAQTKSESSDAVVGKDVFVGVSYRAQKDKYEMSLALMNDDQNDGVNDVAKADQCEVSLALTNDDQKCDGVNDGAKADQCGVSLALMNDDQNDGAKADQCEVSLALMSDDQKCDGVNDGTKEDQREVSLALTNDDQKCDGVNDDTKADQREVSLALTKDDDLECDGASVNIHSSDVLVCSGACLTPITFEVHDKSRRGSASSKSDSVEDLREGYVVADSINILEHDIQSAVIKQNDPHNITDMRLRQQQNDNNHTNESEAKQGKKKKKTKKKKKGRHPNATGDSSFDILEIL